MKIIKYLCTEYDKLNHNEKRRYWSFGIITITIVILFVYSNYATNDFLKEPYLVEDNFNIEKLDILISGKNTYNDDHQFNRRTDVFGYNFTYINNFEHTITIKHHPEIQAGNISVFNGTETTRYLGPGYNTTINYKISIDQDGYNYVTHHFSLTYSDNEKSKVKTKDWRTGFLIHSEESYLTLLLQSNIIKFIWALAIPFVIISVKHLTDLWYGRKE